MADMFSVLKLAGILAQSKQHMTNKEYSGKEVLVKRSNMQEAISIVRGHGIFQEAKRSVESSKHTRRVERQQSYMQDGHG